MGLESEHKIGMRTLAAIKDEGFFLGSREQTLRLIDGFDAKDIASIIERETGCNEWAKEKAELIAGLKKIAEYSDGASCVIDLDEACGVFLDINKMATKVLKKYGAE